MLIRLQTGPLSAIPSSPLTHAVNERERCPKAEVKGSNPFGRANSFNELEDGYAAPERIRPQHVRVFCSAVVPESAHSITSFCDVCDFRRREERRRLDRAR